MSDLSQAIHRASFGYPLSLKDGTALLRAYMDSQMRNGQLRVALEKAQAEVDEQRAVIERLTNELEGRGAA